MQQKSQKTLFIAALLIISALAIFQFSTKQANDLPKLKLAGSIYVGWMPWFLAAEDGTLAAIGKKNGLDIEFVRGDYIETINQFAAGGVDAVVLTNIDAMALLVGSGVATDVILIGSYSNGNDAIMVPMGDKDKSLVGKRLGLVEFSVSHYFLDRYLEEMKIPLDAVSKMNVSDSEIAAAFTTTGSGLDGVVTWNPIVLQIEQQLQGHRVADSQIINKEIADLLVVRRSVLAQHPQFAQALLAIWFQITAKMTGKNKEVVLSELGRLSGGDAAQYQAQLDTTLLLAQPKAALAALKDPAMQKTMAHVREFVDRYQLVNGAPKTDWVSFPDQPQGIIHFNTQPLNTYIASH